MTDNTNTGVDNRVDDNWYDHGHGYVRVTHPIAFAILSRVRLPTRWLVESGELPHDPDCTPIEAVLRG